MIIWLNGTFGAGKTTTGRRLAGRLANARPFDPEGVLREDYWQELTAGFERPSLDIFHVLLHVDSDVLAERIKADQVEAGACQWRLDHVTDYEKARPWMESAADLVIDTTHVPVTEVAERIAVSAERRMAAASALCGGFARPAPPRRR